MVTFAPSAPVVLMSVPVRFIVIEEGPVVEVSQTKLQGLMATF